MTYFLLSNAMYIAIFLGGLVGLGFDCTYFAASGRLDSVPARGGLRSRTLLTLGIVLLGIGLVFFVIMLFLNAAINGPLASSWAVAFITRFIIMSLAFAAFLVILTSWTLKRLQTKG